jgi:hypothetical protein
MRLSNNYLQTGQKEIEEINSLTDKALFEDFETNNKYSVEKGTLIKGMKSKSLSTTPQIVEFEIKDKGTPQVCLLILNDGDLPEEVQLKYGDTVQKFLIDWNEWGWAPISLEKRINIPDKVKFEIFVKNEKPELKLAKVYVRYQDLGYTD